MKLIKTVLWSGLLVLLGAGAAYAFYLSNTVSIGNNTVTTSEAAIKVCDVTGNNRWTTSMSPALNLSAMVPGEERDAFAGRIMYVGNDNSSLETAAGGSRCTTYDTSVPREQSTVAMKLVPTLAWANESCPISLANDLQVKIDVDTASSGFKTLQTWSSNAADVGSQLAPNSASQFKVYTQLASGSTVQNGSCTFTINLTGKQV